MRFIQNIFRRIKTEKEVIGLDLDNNELRCVVLKTGRNCSYEVNKCGIESIPPGVIENNCIKDASTLERAISKLLAKANISAHQCVIAMPDTLVTIKCIDIKHYQENFELSLRQTLEEHIPYPLEEIYFDYQIFNSAHESKSTYKIFLVACRKKHVDARIKIIKRVNLFPFYIEVNSLAIERAFSHFYPKKLIDPCILLHITLSQLTFLFLCKAKRVCSLSEAMIKLDQTTISHQILCAIKTLMFCYPHCEFTKILLIGADPILLESLSTEIERLFRLKTQILSGTNIAYTGGIHSKFFISKFPDFFLSFGLALRAIL
jgi:Tfp pilus assembly PilM family ATPase